MVAKSGNGKTWVADMVFFFWLFSSHLTVASQKHEVEKILQKLNKPAVKSIQSPDGDIIDCVNILNQPAFDHPKLKNHKIQMRPNFHPKGRITHGKIKAPSKSKLIAQLWHQSGSCPEGTIPMRRTTKDDILRANSIQQFGKKNYNSTPILKAVDLLENHEYAAASVNGDKYYGTKASINIWNPRVQEYNEFSLSQVWVMNEVDPNNLETIEAGWQISREIYGDNNTRLFIYWTSDSYRSTGCYNLECSGFIQLDNGTVLGGSIASSVYGDVSSQHEISIFIRKDPKEENWWMIYNDKPVGYWPASLHSHLSDSASEIQWGGEIINLKAKGQHTTTQMGSGHFPHEGFGKASYFKGIQIIDKDHQVVSPNNLDTYVDNSQCYDIVLNGYSGDWGTHFFYGGPGRNPNCP